MNINQTIHKRLLSFKYAFNGLKVVFKEEYNLKIHFIAATLVTISSFLIHINTNEWLAIILSIGVVISSEILNSSIENLCDFVSPQKHQAIKKIKDISAAAVLFASIAALAVGLVIFLPKFHF